MKYIANKESWSGFKFESHDGCAGCNHVDKELLVAER